MAWWSKIVNSYKFWPKEIFLRLQEEEKNVYILDLEVKIYDSIKSKESDVLLSYLVKPANYNNTEAPPQAAVLSLKIR